MNNLMPTWPGWETVRLIGRGSFGTVYEIQREVFGDVERAALKHISIPQSDSEIDSLRGEGLDGESITETFKDQARDIVNEYKLMKKLNDCPNVVSCDDVAFVQQDDGYGWDIFIKMELLTPLLKSLGDGRDTPEAQVIALGKDMCRALCACRKYNIIHRDIKPQNIFVSDAGLYKLGDFGIARTKTMTSTGTAKIGTYDYMAPEVFHAQRYGAGADLYSLGMVLYWLLNRRRCSFQPVEKQRLTLEDKETARKRRMDGEEIPAPAHGSEELKQIVLKACAFDPKDRYQSAEEMLRDLEALSGKGAVPAPEPPAARPMMPAPEDTVNAGDEEAKRPILLVTQSEEHDADGAETVGLFGGVTPSQSAPQPERQDDDTTVGAFGGGVKQPDIETGPQILEEVSTEDEEQTVGAFKLEKDPPSPQPTPQPKPVSKPKRRLWPILAAAVVVVVGVIVLTTTKKDNVTYSLADETLTISGRGGGVNPAEAIPDWTTTKKSNIRRIVIEEGVTSIGDFAFSGCNSLTSVSIPASVTSIGDFAFDVCSSLTSVSIPASVTSIGDFAFSGCNSLTSVSIPASVTSIGIGAFSNCSSLTSVSIPDSVTSIGEGAFSGCSSLNHIYYGGTEAQWNAIVVGGGNNPLSSATVHYNSQ